MSFIMKNVSAKIVLNRTVVVTNVLKIYKNSIVFANFFNEVYTSS